MTYHIRKFYDVDDSYEFIYGNAMMQVQNFHVRWGWMAFPISLAVFALIFLISTIIMTRKDEPWKSSVLAMMYHSFNDDDRKTFGTMATLEEMKSEMQAREVVLVDDEQGNLLFKAKERRPRSHEIDNEKATHALTQGGNAFLEGLNAS